MSWTQFVLGQDHILIHDDRDGFALVQDSRQPDLQWISETESPWMVERLSDGQLGTFHSRWFQQLRPAGG